jgi:hypothetical protein
MLYMKVLFEPFEEDFDLPSAAVQFPYFFGTHGKIVRYDGYRVSFRVSHFK